MSTQNTKSYKFKKNSVLQLSQSNLFKTKLSKKTSRNKIFSFKSSFLNMSNSITKSLKETFYTIKPPEIPLQNKEICAKLKCYQNTQLSIGITKIEFITPYNELKSNSAINIRNSKPKMELTHNNSSSMCGIYYRGTNLKNKKLICLRDIHNSIKYKKHRNKSVTFPMLREVKRNNML